MLLLQRNRKKLLFYKVNIIKSKCFYVYLILACIRKQLNKTTSGIIVAMVAVMAMMVMVPMVAMVTMVRFVVTVVVAVWIIMTVVTVMMVVMIVVPVVVLAQNRTLKIIW